MAMLLPLKKRLQPSSLADHVYEHLRLAIIAAELGAGEKLVELDIARQMSTSQGPVREALQRLERDGLVERQARSATYVTSIPTDEMFELFSVRKTIEAFAIRRTVACITPDQCDALDDLIAQMVDAGSANDLLLLSEYDMAFHRSIVAWSGSPGLLRVWTPLSSQNQRFMVASHREHYPNYVEIGTRHSPIVDALRAGDGDAAERAVREHIMLIWPKIHP
ncbi:MAG: GntR family transcriptional regulator [Chloroflexota bacterium]|nr:GntR family transcriptional regulator [Chloroflexota bacterium]